MQSTLHRTIDKMIDFKSQNSGLAQRVSVMEKKEKRWHSVIDMLEGRFGEMESKFTDVHQMTTEIHDQNESLQKRTDFLETELKKLLTSLDASSGTAEGPSASKDPSKGEEGTFMVSPRAQIRTSIQDILKKAEEFTNPAPIPCTAVPELGSSPQSGLQGGAPTLLGPLSVTTFGVPARVGAAPKRRTSAQARLATKYGGNLAATRNVSATGRIIHTEQNAFSRKEEKKYQYYSDNVLDASFESLGPSGLGASKGPSGGPSGPKAVDPRDTESDDECNIPSPNANKGEKLVDAMETKQNKTTDGKKEEDVVLNSTVKSPVGANVMSSFEGVHGATTHAVSGGPTGGTGVDGTVLESRSDSREVETLLQRLASAETRIKELEKSQLEGVESHGARTTGETGNEASISDTSTSPRPQFVTTGLANEVKRFIDELGDTDTPSDASIPPDWGLASWKEKLRRMGY